VTIDDHEHRITHLGICVRDLECSVVFYERALGFVTVGRMQATGPETETILSVPDAVVDLVYLERDGLRIELLAYLGGARGDGTPRPMDQVGLTHLSIRVGSIDDLVGPITNEGGSVLAETEVCFEWGNRGVMTLDPDGTRIELIERRPG
jgi:catechol 2,3-dioxygenase-like lactoylglutathione lyase family enzyme